LRRLLVHYCGVEDPYATDEEIVEDPYATDEEIVEPSAHRSAVPLPVTLEVVGEVERASEGDDNRYADVYEPCKASSHAWTTVWTSSAVPTTDTVAGSSPTSAVFMMRAIKRPGNPSTDARMMRKPNRVVSESFTALW
jgi:hypothetical protein